MPDRRTVTVEFPRRREGFSWALLFTAYPSRYFLMPQSRNRHDLVKGDQLPLILIGCRDSVHPYRSAITRASVGNIVHDGDDVKAPAQNLGCGDSEESTQASGILH